MQRNLKTTAVTLDVKDTSEPQSGEILLTVTRNTNDQAVISEKKIEMNLSGKTEPSNWQSPQPSPSVESQSFVLDDTSGEFTLLEATYQGDGAWNLHGIGPGEGEDAFEPQFAALKQVGDDTQSSKPQDFLKGFLETRTQPWQISSSALDFYRSQMLQPLDDPQPQAQNLILTRSSRSTLLLSDEGDKFVDITFLADAPTANSELTCVSQDRESADLAGRRFRADKTLNETTVRCHLPRSTTQGLYSLYLEMTHASGEIVVSRNSVPISILQGQLELNVGENAVRLLQDGTHEIKLQVGADWGSTRSLDVLKHLDLHQVQYNETIFELEKASELVVSKSDSPQVKGCRQILEGIVCEVFFTDLSTGMQQGQQISKSRIGLVDRMSPDRLLASKPLWLPVGGPKLESIVSKAQNESLNCEDSSSNCQGFKSALSEYRRVPEIQISSPVQEDKQMIFPNLSVLPFSGQHLDEINISKEKSLLAFLVPSSFCNESGSSYTLQIPRSQIQDTDDKAQSFCWMFHAPPQMNLKTREALQQSLGSQSASLNEASLTQRQSREQITLAKNEFKTFFANQAVDGSQWSETSQPSDQAPHKKPTNLQQSSQIQQNTNLTFSSINKKIFLGDPSYNETIDLLASNPQQLLTSNIPDNCLILSANFLRCLGPLQPFIEGSSLNFDPPLPAINLRDESLKEGIDVEFQQQILVQNRKSRLQFRIRERNETLWQRIEEMELRCAFKAQGGPYYFGKNLEFEGDIQVCAFEGIPHEVDGQVFIFLSPDGEQMIPLNGSDIFITREPILGSVVPSNVVAPEEGDLLELMGTHLDSVKSVRLEAESGLLLDNLPYKSRSKDKVVFPWPEGLETLKAGDQLWVSVQNEAGLQSFELRLKLGSSLQLTMGPQAVGFAGNDLIFSFSASQVPDALRIDCIAGTETNSTLVVKAEPLDQTDGSCELRCLLPGHRLTPGIVNVSLKVEKEPRNRIIGSAIQLDLRNKDTKLDRQQVFSSRLPFELLINASWPASQFFSPHSEPSIFLTERDLWCLFNDETQNSMVKVRAKISKDKRQVWCVNVPYDPGNYKVALSYDGLNLLSVPGTFRVLSPAAVVVTDVGPRLIPLREGANQLQQMKIQLHGKGLNLIKQDLIQVEIDTYKIAMQDVKIDAEEHLLTLMLPRQPEKLLRIKLLARQQSNQTLADIYVRTVPQPSIEPQSTQVYQGEDIRLSGENIADQLDLTCTLDKMTAQAKVLDSQTILCPSSLLKQRTNQGEEGLQSIQVRSQSLQQLISPGLDPRVGAELVPIPTVESVSRVQWSTEPAECCSAEPLTLTMASQVLDRDIKIKYGSKEGLSCAIEPGFKVVCPGPFALEQRKNYSLSLQFFPGAPYVDIDRQIIGIAWPILQEVHPKALISSIPGQTLTLKGKHFTDAQQIIQGMSLSTGHRLYFRTLNDTALLVEDLPALASAEGKFRKISIALTLTELPESPPLDVIVIDQPQIRAYSSTFSVQSSEPTKILIETHDSVHEFLNNECFMRSVDGRNLHQERATMIGFDLLECSIPTHFSPDQYQFGISARPDVYPSSYEDLYVLTEPQLSRVSGVGAYVHNNEEINLDIYGTWDWYEGLAEPLIILTDHITGAIVSILPGQYDPDANGMLIHFTLPQISQDHSGLVLEISQTGSLSSSEKRSRHGFSLIPRPEILDVSPRVIDSRAKGSVWVTVVGRNLFMDGGLPEDKKNIYCAVDGVRTELIHHNKSQIECKLYLETEVFTFDHTYEISVSVNFGIQWVRADRHLVSTMVLPDIASIEPRKLSSNLVQRITVQLTRSAQIPPTIIIEGFDVLSQQESQKDSLTLLLQSQQRFAPGPQPLQIWLSLPQIKINQYKSQFAHLVIQGGTSMTGNTPRMVLGFWGWTKLTIQGSHLDLQPLYCKIRDRLYQFTFDSDHDGSCFVSFDPSMQNETVKMVTALGETVPGSGEIEVIQGSAYELWPQLSGASSMTNLSVQLNGSGFIEGRSQCHITGLNQKITAAAEVISPKQLSCRLPKDHSFTELGQVVKVQIQNVFGDDLADFLWSQTQSIETEPKIWTIGQPSIQGDSTAIQNSTNTTMDPERRLEILKALQAHAPQVLLEGTETGFSLNITSFESQSNTSVSNCFFQKIGSKNTQLRNESSCSIIPEWSKIFLDKNMVDLSITADNTEVVLGRSLPILRELEIQYSKPQMVDGNPMLELYLSPGPSTVEWFAVGENTIPINFRCNPVLPENEFRGYLAPHQFSSIANFSYGLLPGHFVVSCPFDWTFDALKLNLTYEVENQEVTLDASLSSINRFSIPRAIYDNTTILLGPLRAQNLKDEQGHLFCRIQHGEHGPIFSKLILIVNDTWASCQLPLWNLNLTNTNVKPQVEIILVQDNGNPKEIVVSWPSEISPAEPQQIQKYFLPQSISQRNTSVLKVPKLISVSPSITLAEECQSNSIDDDEAAIVHGSNFGLSTSFLIKQLSSGTLTPVDCQIESKSSANCKIKSLVCSILTIGDFEKNESIEFEIHGLDSSLMKQNQSLAIGDKDPVKFSVVAGYASMKCADSSNEEAEYLEFEGKSGLKKAIIAADRQLQCVYSEGGKDYTGPISEQDSSISRCPTLHEFSTERDVNQSLTVSIVAGSTTSDHHLNLTAQACVIERNSPYSNETHLAWLQPPGAPCGQQSHHLLMVKGRLLEDDNLELQNALIPPKLKKVEGGGSSSINTFEVALKVSCGLGDQNLTTVSLDLKSRTNGKLLSKAHLLVFEQIEILSGKWARDDRSTSEGTGGVISLAVDRPWDFNVILGSSKTEVRCDYGLQEMSRVMKRDGFFVCAAPETPGDLNVELRLFGGGQASHISRAPILVSRRTLSNNDTEAVLSHQQEFVARIISPQDIVYGQQNAVVLVIEVGMNSLKQEDQCLLRANRLPILAVEADRLSQGLVGDQDKVQFICVISDAILAKLERSGVNSIDIAIGNRANFIPQGIWPTLLILNRVTIASIIPQRLVIHPSKVQNVILQGNFQTLVDSANSNSEIKPIWVRLGDEVVSEILAVQEVRSDKLTFQIHGSKLRAGAELIVEVGDLPNGSQEPRVLSVAPSNLSAISWMPIEDHMPKIALLAAPRSFAVQITLLQEPDLASNVIVCAERKIGSKEKLSWSPAEALNKRDYLCKLESGRIGTRQLALGIQNQASQDRQILTDFVDVELKAFELQTLSPTSGLAFSNQVVSITGRGFVSLMNFGGGLACKFGKYNLETKATIISDSELECETPATAAQQVTVSLVPLDKKYHKIVQDRKSRAVQPLRFSFYQLPVVQSVYPESISTAIQAHLNLTLQLSAPVQKFQGQEIICRLTPSEYTTAKGIGTSAAAEILEPSLLLCPFESFEWHAKFRTCKLQLSFNGGADFGTVYENIRVLQPPRAPNLATYSHSINSQAVEVTVPVHNYSETGNSLSCLATLDQGEYWYFPAKFRNESHALCHDGQGLLKNGGQIQVVDSSAGLVSSSASLSLSIPGVNETLKFDDSNKTIAVQPEQEQEVYGYADNVTKDSAQSAYVPTIMPVFQKERDLQVLAISPEDSLEPAPVLSLSGCNLKDANNFTLRLESQEPYWNQQHWNFSATVLNSLGPDQSLALNRTPELLSSLSQTYGGLFFLSTDDDHQSAFPILILSKTSVLNVTENMTTQRRFLDDPDGLASFLTLTAQNVPTENEVNIWCAFTVVDNTTYVGTREVLVDTWTIETSVVSRKERTRVSKLGCELPASVVSGPTMESFGDVGRDIIPGRLVFGSWGKRGVQDPQNPRSLEFSVKLARLWSVTSMELRDSRIYVTGHHFSKEARLVCLVEASGSRLSRTVVVNSTVLYCPIQSFGGTAQVRLRDLSTGDSSDIYSLSRILPTFQKVEPKELYFPSIDKGSYPEVYALGIDFTPDCKCLLNGNELLNTSMLNSSALFCDIQSSAQLTFMDSRGKNSSSWTIAVKCSGVAWVSHEISIVLRNSTILFNTTDSSVTESTLLDGFNQVTLVGQQLHPGLLCHQSSYEDPSQVYESFLTNVDRDNRTALCKVEPDLFLLAPITGRSVQLWISGEHVLQEYLDVTYYPRLQLSLDEQNMTLYRDMAGFNVELISNQALDKLAEQASIKCLFRPDYGYGIEQGTVLNISYFSKPVLTSESTLQCPLPRIKDSDLKFLWLTLRIERKGLAGFVDHSSPVRLRLKNPPVIMAIEPTVLPAGEPTTPHIVKLIMHDGLDPEVHALRIGDADNLSYLQVDQSDGSFFFTAPEAGSGFSRLSIHLLTDMKIGKRLEWSQNHWETLIALEYLELPQAFTVIPNQLPAGPNPHGNRHQVVVVGRNYTSSTECVIDGTLTPTRWLASNLVECEIPANGRAGGHSLVRIRERGRYFSRSPAIRIDYTSQAYVYRVEPPRIMSGRVATLIKVYIADMGGDQNNAKGSRFGYYCRFGSRSVRAQAVLDVFDSVEDLKAAHGNVNLPTVMRREVHCRSPLVSSPQVVQVEIVDPTGKTFTFGSVNSTFEFLPRPSFHNISRYVAPVGPQAHGLDLIAAGTQFDERYSYKCIYILLSFKNQSVLTYGQRIDSQTLKCPIPSTYGLLQKKLLEGGPIFADLKIEAEWPTHGLGLTDDSESLALATAGRVLLYHHPTVSAIWPNWGSTTGGTPVYVSGKGLDLGLAQQILCKFGDEIVIARVITQSTLLRCMSPANPQGMSLFELSVDNVEYFGGENSTSVYFTYVSDPVFSATVESVNPSPVGTDNSVTLTVAASGYLTSPMLEQGYPLCRFTFTGPALSRVTAGVFLNETHVKCPSPPAVPKYIADCGDGSGNQCLFDNMEAKTSISYNGVEFWPASSSAALTSLIFEQRPAIVKIKPSFGFAETPLGLTLYGSRFDGAAQVAYGEPGPDFTEISIPQSASAVDEKIVIPRIPFTNVSRAHGNTLYGERATRIEVFRESETAYSYDEIIHQYVGSPVLTSASTDVVTAAGGALLVIRGRGFQNTTDLACKFGTFWSIDAIFFNETVINCTTPPLPVSAGESVQVAVTFNGEELATQADNEGSILELLVGEVPTAIRIEPQVVLWGEKEIQVTIVSQGLLDTPSLSCKVGVLILQGTYGENEDGDQYVNCTIPSHDYLASVSSDDQWEPLPTGVFVEASNDGVLFSDDECLMRFVPENQMGPVFVEPANGLQEGGTILNITFEDLPLVTHTPITCTFPGQPPVLAQQITPILIRCQAPPLVLGADGVEDFIIFAQAVVKLHIGWRELPSFIFTYSTRLHVDEIDPPNTVHPPTFLEDPDPAGIAVMVHGESFIPGHSTGLRCRFEVDSTSFLEVVASSISNSSMICSIPGSVLQRRSAERKQGEKQIILPIEVSLNGGQQYTSSGKGLLLREADLLASNFDEFGDPLPPVSPNFAYVRGGTLLTVVYERAFEPTSPRARCFFHRIDPEDGREHYLAMPLFALNEQEQYVQCFAPPAHLLTDELYARGGTVDVYISTNGRDLSANTCSFRYRPVPLITRVVPIRLLAADVRTIDIWGLNFFDPYAANDLEQVEDPLSGPLVRLTALAEPSRWRRRQVTFVNETLLKFEWPARHFQPGEQVRLELTLDGDTFTKSPAPITVYGGVTLGRVRPVVIHQSTEGGHQDLYAETITNLLDTESLDLMRCRFHAPAANPLDSSQPSSILRDCDDCLPSQCSCTTAVFINRTLVHCPVPVFARTGAVEVDVSVDTSASYSTPEGGVPVRIWVVNSTDYFHQRLVLNSTKREQDFHQVNATKVAGSLAYWQTVGRRTYLSLEYQNTLGNAQGGTISNKWGGVGMIHVRVAGITRPAIATEGSPAVLELPEGLTPGDYPIMVSVDGGTTFVGPGPGEGYLLEIKGCPAGSFCDQNIEQKCLEGHFCPQVGSLSPIKCAIGTVGRHFDTQAAEAAGDPFSKYANDIEWLSECEVCPSGSHCPTLGLPYLTHRACPPGYICGSAGTGSLNQLEPCPAGMYCPLEGGPIYCPEGAWCPEATSTLRAMAGNFTTPQPCRDGVRCGAIPSDAAYFSAHPDAWEEPTGARDPGGVAECPVGSFCADGLVHICPPGSFCRASGLRRPTECPPGSFRSEVGDSECRLCPPGSFCYYAGQAIPYKCKPGFTCQYEGGATPIAPCPAGSYCRLAIAASFSNSTMQAAHHPLLCQAKTYCLWGVYDPVVDPTNPQAAQICIAGTFCGEGSETPTGKGLCRAGYYCPPNSSEMIDAPPGTHTPDAGYAAAQPCARGTYQNKPRSPQCKLCSKGHACPREGMKRPELCGKGTYSKNLGETQCTDCPQGTYSDELGLTAEEACKPCEASFLCDVSGLQKMKEAVPCEEGYLCGARTTRTVMLANPCPAGYYSGLGASSLEDAYLCPASRYCARGTSASKVGAAECLPSFFCPFGTAASLRPDGTFGDDIRMVPRSILVALIEKLLVKNAQVQRDFGIEEKQAALKELQDAYSAESAKDDDDKSEAKLERYQARIVAAEWDIEAYHNRTIHTQARERYLKVNLTLGACEEDAGLPAELVSMYFQDGAMLKCPSGTSSERGSWCLGQCTKPRSSTKPISILDPLDKRDLGVEGGRESLQPKTEEDEDMQRRLEEEEDEWAPRWDGLPAYTLRPLETARITLDLRDVPPGFEYNEHYAIIILGRANSTESITEEVREQEDWQKLYELGQKQQKLPFYFDAVNDEVTSETGGTVKRAVLELKIFNHQDFESEFRVGIYLFHGLFRPYLDYLANKVSLEFYRANRQLIGTDHTWAILISESLMGGVTLPYNTPDLGNEPLFYIDMTSTAEGINIGPRGLVQDVFDSTYWQSKQVNAVIMPWIPFFTNCEGYDEHMILYDVFERGGRCDLPEYEDIRIVNPIPSNGLDPIADRCAPNDEFPELLCRFDEPLHDTEERSTSRWYELKEERDLFHITRSPIPIEMFKLESEVAENPQTYYIQLIDDGSDDLVTASFHPELGHPEKDEDDNPIVPTVVEANFFYYQQSRDVKLMAKVEVHLKEYLPFKKGPGADPIYRLRLTYEALSYFDLINTFQFTLPIYFLLFIFISIILILSIIVFWLLNLQFSTFKRPPALRFTHLARVTFMPPAQGCLLASVPALVVAGCLRLLQIADLSADVAERWTDFGGEVSNAAKINQVRGRLGLVFSIVSVIFLRHGGECIITQPSEDEEELILERRREAKALERLEQSLDDSEAEVEAGQEDEKEQDVKLVRAIDWKRRHYFVNCMMCAIILMVRLEFSYSELFSKNIMEFLVLFTIFDLFLEQLLTRIAMGEALLVSPILGAVVTTEFIMTMGSENFQSFVTAYFVETLIIVASRSYAGPWVEKLEVKTQRWIIEISKNSKLAQKVFRSFLVAQLNSQLQLINLREYQAAGSSEEQEAAAEELARENGGTNKKEVIEKSEGLEALLGSVASYAAHTQALFVTPVSLVFIILFANETKIPQGYQIRHADLQYYLLFSIIIVLPRMVVDAFLLHVLETVHGFKVYDYFTYCDYRFRIRPQKYVSKGALDRSVALAWRSIDNLSFSSQYYYIISLTTWGILFLYFGLTAMIRNNYNPFADPVLPVYVGGICALATPIQSFLGKLASYISLWEVVLDENQKVDVGAINRLDHANNVKKLVVSIQTNPFRHKFMRVNREWLIHNIALILGGKNYLARAGPELQYLQAIYQRAVNAEAIDVRLRQEQAKIAQDLALMPYNARAQAREQARFNDGRALDVVISDDSVSDIPAPQWRIPAALTKSHVQKLGLMWLGFARQTMRLKAMVSDLVARQLKAHCQRCRSVYRLQVIQKIGFTQLCDKFRAEHQGVNFSVERWRKFYERRQVFITLCMECAYIDNLNAAHIVEQDGDLQRLMAENALKNVGAHDQYVAQKLGLPHVRRIIMKWLWLAKSSLLHRVDKEQQLQRKAFAAHQRRLREDEALRLGQQLPPEEEKSASTAREPSDAEPALVSQSDSLTISSVGLV